MADPKPKGPHPDTGFDPPPTLAERGAQIQAAAQDVAGGEVSLGDALRKHFPTAEDGSTSPEMELELHRACEQFIRQWAHWNVPVADEKGGE